MESAMSTIQSGSALVIAPVDTQKEVFRTAAPEADLVSSLDLPLSTYRACVRRGGGPRTFKMGRRNYILFDDWDAWLRQLAETGGIRACKKGLI
jgi:hypothetical protein